MAKTTQREVWVVKSHSTEDALSNIILFSTEKKAWDHLKENAPEAVVKAMKKDEWYDEEGDEHDTRWSIGSYRVG